MKNTLLILITSLFIFSCVNKTPSLNEEDYKKEQLEYEALKEKLNEDKSAFFKENEDALMKKISLFKKLKDSSTTFANVNRDSTFYLGTTKLNDINYRLGRKKNAVKVVFLAKNEDVAKKFYFKEAYKQLYSCEKNTGESCEFMKSEVLKEFLDIKYAFVVTGYTIREPSIDKESTFKSGLYYGTVLVYDIVNDTAFYQYNYVATNSEEISYRETKYSKRSPIKVITEDFQSNIKSSFEKETLKHFKFF